jgi:hypothetical protein
MNMTWARAPTALVKAFSGVTVDRFQDFVREIERGLDVIRYGLIIDSVHRRLLSDAPAISGFDGVNETTSP